MESFPVQSHTATVRRMPARAPAQEGRAASPELDLDVLPELLGYNVRLAQLALQRRFQRAMAGSEVGSGLFGLLVLCGANPGIAQVQVAQQLTIDKASVVSLVDRLESQGWVVRRRSQEDRRRHGLFLTPEGERELAALKVRMMECERALEGLFDLEERRVLIRLLQRLKP